MSQSGGGAAQMLQLLRPFTLGARRSVARSMATSSSSADQDGPITASIRTKLTALEPAELSIVNDSWQHKHHAAMRAQGGGNGETHFTIHIVSEIFQGKTTIQRHRMIYDVLTEELQQGLHSLSLKTRTPAEIQKQTASSVAS
ncbi:BolA domain UV induced protein Uvi31 [Marasmius tenuissimus]|nr:BolA domain UV induced protein Uvi31 [Marasmius tenuissimus]